MIERYFGETDIIIYVPMYLSHPKLFGLPSAGLSGDEWEHRRLMMM